MLGRLLKTAATAAVILGLSSVAGGAADKTVIVGHFGNATPMQLVAASDELSKETGWTVEWRKFQAGTDVIAAMASGDIKLSELGSSPLAIAATQGVDLELFMISDGIGSAEALIARDGAGITKLEDLKGKKVGVPLGSTAHFSLMGALENAGIPASDVTVLGMSPDQIAAAWAQDQIDATFVWDPVQTKVKANGKMIINAGEVTGKPTFDGWVVNREFAAENKDFMVAFVKAIAKANTSYTSNPDAWTAELRAGQGDCQAHRRQSRRHPDDPQGLFAAFAQRAGLEGLAGRRHGRQYGRNGEVPEGAEEDPDGARRLFEVRQSELPRGGDEIAA